ncbi:MAG: hypothetical protein IJX40_02440 [Alistipes sp.]|nr:hypothetical protein [Alistipes sp.]
MEQNNSQLSPKASGIIAALCCFIVLSLIYFLAIGRSLVADNNNEKQFSGETIDYMTDDDYDEMAKEGNASEVEVY